MIIIGRKPVLTTKGDVLTHDGSKETRLGVGDSGQYLTSDSSDNLIWANPPEGGQLFNSNVLLNAYWTAENGTRPVLKMVEGIVDAFEDESGVDSSASSNETYLSNFYNNKGVPALISQTTDTAIGNMNDLGRLAAAFDGDNSQVETEAAIKGFTPTHPAYAGKDWGSGIAKTVTQIKAWGSTTFGFQSSANDTITFTLQSSTDNFSSSIVDLGSISFTDFSTNTEKLFPESEINTSIAYRYHRLKITTNGGTTLTTDLRELEFYVEGAPVNMTLISESQTAKTEANGANIVLFAEDPEADITLNTNLKAYVSRDGGTTFTQVTLSDAGEFEKGNLLTGTVDISSQPTGTEMEWKVETDNKKALNLHGVGLEWR